MNKDLKGVKEPADKGVGEVGEGGIPGRGNSQGEDPEIEVCLTLLMNCNAASVKKAKWGKSGRRGQVIGGGGQHGGTVHKRYRSSADLFTLGKKANP